jgi:predicted nucleotidyltransferase
MKDIQNKLKEIAADKNIHLLYACETGSRAWGFPSPDSDYDVRFIYRHDTQWYLSLSKHKDSIELMEGELDATGWDLRKCLLLLKKSNVPLIERFQSPVIYWEEPGFKADFKKLIAGYYNPIAVFFHHYSLAIKFWEEIKEQPDCKLKSLFYLFRSLLSCNWIIHDDSVLPMDIEGLMKYNREEVNTSIRELITLKSAQPESYRHPWNFDIKEWITCSFNRLGQAKASLKVNKTGMGALNDYFLKTVYANHNHRDS